VPGAVSVMAATRRGGMMAAPEVYYMQKIVSGPAGRNLLSLDYSAEKNIDLLAAELGKPVSELNVAIIDKGRNHDLIKRVQDHGANWVRFAEGDVAMAVAAAVGDVGVDLLLGIGGNPEGVVTACAVQALGGFMEGRLMPLSPDEMSRALGAGYDVEKATASTSWHRGSGSSLCLPASPTGYSRPESARKARACCSSRLCLIPKWTRRACSRCESRFRCAPKIAAEGV